MMKKYLTIFLFSYFTALSAQKDSRDLFLQMIDEDFSAFKQSIDADFNDFRNQINEEYAEFLTNTWENKNGNKPKPEPAKTPEIPPVVLKDVDVNIPKEKKIEVKVDAAPPKQEEPRPITEIDYLPKPLEKSISFFFYGTEGIIRFDLDRKASLGGVSEKEVSHFWKELSGENYDNLLADCLNQKIELDLCDWAYYKLTEKVAETVYGKSNDAVVLQFWILSQSGFKARLGREGNNIHLLLNTTDMIFNKPYWNLNDGLYFLLDGCNVEKMNIVGMSFPETKALRMTINNQNKFLPNDSQPRTLTSKKYPDVTANVVCNYNLLAFMNDYPNSSMVGSEDSDWLKYAYTPLSKSAKDRLYPALEQQIKDKAEAEAANILLNFVQTAFEYKTDNEVWGVERPFIPEETLYYPYCDCEDRAILFCRLVTDLLGLKTALVSYPGHLAAAVQFKSEIPGDYFIIEGKRFLICDPTYINASIGQSMPRKDNSTAKVFPL